ncbi:MAG TPA: replication-associated recombination protein A [Spirochaetota bacterium]|nr:replication-associated recombination protein A [Spirochaetota bacterium]HOR43429.1 replication-associated recombination protein A [Spirochaetota bacterium]HOU83450.1 replication-associated recombination protein A [Spirochaetota bacterium]HPK56383.1 replication-associated recombination protein A [Spirochaetota bacterium]HQE58414.1 replication-associated recombination protein A [Spirochaetota bacterium]
MQNLFHDSRLIPLAERIRPKTISEYFGQEELTGEGRVVRMMIEKNLPFSMILWGEPGCGKTTLAGIIAESLDIEFHFLSAISCGVSEVRNVIQLGKKNKAAGSKTLLFLDEIHRFNKSQQDSVLSAVENGDIILIGATTENPSFSVISPLLSRTRVIKLKKHSRDSLKKILNKAITEDEIISKIKIEFNGAEDELIDSSNGDARRMLNILETAALTSKDSIITSEILKEAVKEVYSIYDKKGDNHYDSISAFIKSMRGSDPDAAVLYLAKMISAGEDPMFIARRMVIFASEDIGNASPTALSIALSALNAVEKIGMPESRIILSQCACFLASSPKSNASYAAINKALEIVESNNVEIPYHLRNAPTSLMREMGNSIGYKYPHDYPGSFVKEKYLPDSVSDLVLYNPTENGSEKNIKERLRVLWPERFER